MPASYEPPARAKWLSTPMSPGWLAGAPALMLLLMIVSGFIALVPLGLHPGSGPAIAIAIGGQLMACLAYREHRRREVAPPSIRRTNSDDPNRVPVQVLIYCGDVRNGADVGMLSVEDCAVRFTGELCGFRLGVEDLRGEDFKSSDRFSLILKGEGNWRVAIVPFRRIQPFDDVDRRKLLKAQLDTFARSFRSPKPSQGPRLLPPARYDRASLAGLRRKAVLLTSLVIVVVGSPLAITILGETRDGIVLVFAFNIYQLLRFPLTMMKTAKYLTNLQEEADRQATLGPASQEALPTSSPTVTANL